MPNPFDGPMQRFDRARAQIEELKAAEKVFLAGAPYSSTTRREGDRFVFIAHIRENPDPALGLLAAEVVHNLRAGLDNLMWGVAGKALINDRRLNFPIYDDPLLFVAYAYPLLHKLPSRLFEAFEWCQPYNANVSSPDRLSMLRDFWNHDKHRAPIACGGAAMAAAFPAVYGDPPAEPPGALTDPHMALYEGKEIGWVLASAYPSAREEDIRPHFSYFMGFEAEGIERVYALFGLEKTCHIITDEVVPAISEAWNVVKAQGNVLGSP